MIRGLLFLVVLAVAGLYGLAFLDRQSSRFDSRVDANEIMLKGWLPRALPAEATEIWEVHYLDSNQRYGGFKFSETDIAELKQNLGRVSSEPSACKLPWKGMIGEGREWYENEHFFVAIDWKNTDAEFWLCYRRGI